MTQTPVTPSAPSDGKARTRLLNGLEQSIRKRGYAATTVADVVAEAGTSKRTFYREYDSKGDCLLDHYRRFHARVAERIATEPPLARTSIESTVRGVEIYFQAFVLEPELARAHLLEILALGADGVRVRREATRGYVRGMQQVMSAPRDDRPGKRLDDVRALGIVGGINEIALDALDDGSPDRREAAVADAVAFVRAVIHDLPDAAAP